MIWESLYLMLYIMNKQSLILPLQSTLIIGLDIVSILTLLRAIALSLGPSISFLIIIKHVHPWCSGLFCLVSHHASFHLAKVDPFVFNITLPCSAPLLGWPGLVSKSSPHPHVEILSIFQTSTNTIPSEKFFSSLSNDPSQKLGLNIL